MDNPGGSTSVPNATFPLGCQTLYDSNGDICTDTGCGNPDPNFLINELGASGPGCMTFGNSLFAASSDVIGMDAASIDVNCTGETSFDLNTASAQAMADKYGATLEEVESLFNRIEANANTTSVCATTISDIFNAISLPYANQWDSFYTQGTVSYDSRWSALGILIGLMVLFKLCTFLTLKYVKHINR